MGRHPNNKVWEYFDYISDAVAQCQQCKAMILTPNDKRQNMVRHLFDLHGINTYTSGPKVGLIGKPAPTLKRPRRLKKYIKQTTQAYIIHDTNGKKTETYNESNDETLNNDQQNTSEIDSLLEYSSIRQTQDEDNMDPLYNKINFETPAIKIQNSKDGLKNIISESILNQVNFTNGVSSSSNNNSASTIEDSQLLSETCLPKGFSIYTPNEADMMKANALAEKLKAEARYFNELAELTRSKRVYVDLQCQQLRNQISLKKTMPENTSTEIVFPMDEI